VKKLKNLNRTLGFLFYKKRKKNLNSDFLGFLGFKQCQTALLNSQFYDRSANVATCSH